MKSLFIYEQIVFANGLELILKDIDSTIEVTKCFLYKDLDILLKESKFDLIFITKDANFNINDIIPKLRNHNKNCKIIMVTGNTTKINIKLYEKYNINGVILKQYSQDRIDSIIRLILSGSNHIPSELCNHNLDKITKREHELISFLFKGLSNKQIAYNMNISESTTKIHVSNLLRKFNCYNRTGLIHYLTEEGYL